MTLDAQFATMAFMMISGAALGLLFDAYRVLSGEFRFPRWIIPPLDLLFWAVGTVAVFRVLFLSNGGQVRMYVFLAMMIGVCAYYGLFSGIFVKVIQWWIGFVKKAIRILLTIGHVLLVRPMIGLYRLTIVIFGFLAVLSIFLFKLVLQLLYPMQKMALWIGRPLGRRLYALIRGERWIRPAIRLILRFFQGIRIGRRRK